MNYEQSIAVETALAGHNLLLLGSAGTGKSSVIIEVYERMKEIGKSVKVTCSTGIACSLYPNDMSVCTVHKYLGLSDGRYNPADITKIHSNNGYYSYVKQNLNIDCLIVDECSMISKILFHSILAVCQPSIQLIFAGDFYQLPPVANLLYGDEGEYCFESQHFDILFPHKVILHQVMRTKDQRLLKAIKQVFSGDISPETEHFLQSLSRPLPFNQHSNSIKLFSRNDFVDDFNRTSLLNFPGPLYEFKSTDCGEEAVLRNISAPKNLWVKVGCPVILLQNISDQLVNGIFGNVISITTNGPMVEFPAVEAILQMGKVKFTIFDPASNKNIAERHQYPLKPAFGLTIHKAQGMSLDSVEIDCREIFRPGQLGVALSRATNTQGLRVINFHRRYAMKPQALITDFMENESSEILPNLSCCLTQKCITVQEVDDNEGIHNDNNTKTVQGENKIEESVTPYFHDTVEERLQDVLEQPEFEEEDLDDDFNLLIASIVLDENQAHDFEFPEGFCINTMIEGLYVEKEVTSSHKRLNKIVSAIDRSKLKLFTKKMLLKLGTFAKRLVHMETHKQNASQSSTAFSIPEKKLSSWYSLVHEYNISAEYRMHCLSLFEGHAFCDEHMIICYRILEFVRMFYIKEKVNLLKIGSTHVCRRYVTNASNARVRYVAGYCVSKLRTNYLKAQKSKMFSTSKEGQESYYEAKCKASIINLLKEDEHYLNETSIYPESLLDVQRRQRVSKSLVNVSDCLYQFFIALTESILHLLIYENLLQYGKDMYAKCLEQVFHNAVLYQHFFRVVTKGYSYGLNQQIGDTGEEMFDIDNLLNEVVLKSSQMPIVYMDLVNKFMRVLIAQFRKDVKISCKLEKKMAHRKQIKVSQPAKVSSAF